MFVGRHLRQLDDKGRVAVPAEFVDLLEGADREALYVTPGKQGCIWLVPPSYYEGDFVRAVAATFQPAGGAGGGIPDQFFHVCQRRTLDKSGRILIDEDARNLAMLPQPDGAEKVTVVVCGSGRYLQVWSKAEYDAKAAPARLMTQNLPGGGNAFGGVVA